MTNFEPNNVTKSPSEKSNNVTGPASLLLTLHAPFLLNVHTSVSLGSKSGKDEDRWLSLGIIVCNSAKYGVFGCHLRVEVSFDVTRVENSLDSLPM